MRLHKRLKDVNNTRVRLQDRHLGLLGVVARLVDHQGSNAQFGSVVGTHQINIKMILLSTLLLTYSLRTLACK
jgi:hypothetical protein